MFSKFLPLSLVFLYVVGCQPKLTAEITKSYTALPDSSTVYLYFDGDVLPDSTEELGDVKIGDTGFSIKCSFDHVFNLASEEAKKHGGNGVQIMNYQNPNFTSTCFRMEAKILRIPEFPRSAYSEDSLKALWQNRSPDPLEGFYESKNQNFYGKFKYAVVKDRDDTEFRYKVIYLDGAERYARNIWSEGDLVGELKKTMTPNMFVGDILLPNKSIGVNTYLSIERGIMRIYSDEIGEQLWVRNYPESGTTLAESAQGTGFLISPDGLIATNQHLVASAQTITVRGIDEDFSKKHEAEVLVTDINNDLAILKLKQDTTLLANPSLPFGFKTEQTEVGESVFALGYPLQSTMGEELKLTDGIISSRTGYGGDITSYQISVPVQPGNSGGPLFDSNGNLVGVVNAKLFGADNASYAVKASYLNVLLENLSGKYSLNFQNQLDEVSLTEQVKTLRNYVYLIEVH